MAQREEGQALYQDINEKLDRLLATQTNQLTAQTNLLVRMEAVENTMAELNRTVRGHNGTPGMVTELALLKEKLTHVGDSCDEKSDSGETITFKWIVEKASMPVVTALIIWALTKFFPQLFSSGITP